MSNFIWLHFLNAIFLILLTFTLSNVASLPFGGEIKKTKTGCKEIQEQSFRGYNCQRSDYTSIPDDLKTNIEILYMTTNRLREISTESLKIYSSLRFLYLDDNIIMHFDEDVFLATPYLEALDLSLNPLTKLPVSLAQLPRLRHLYLTSIELPYTELENFTLIAGQASSPLEYISLSNSKLKKIPPLGGLLSLNRLDISRNGYLEMTPSDFGAACKLKTVNITDSMKALHQDTSCTSCHALRLWFQQTNVQVIPKDFTCPQDKSKCSNEADLMINEARQARTHCEAAVQLRDRTVKARVTWFWIGVACGLFFLIFLLVTLFIFWNRRTRLRNTSATRATVKDTHHDPAGETSAKLLDSSAAPATTPLDQKPIS